MNRMVDFCPEKNDNEPFFFFDNNEPFHSYMLMSTDHIFSSYIFLLSSCFSLCILVSCQEIPAHFLGTRSPLIEKTQTLMTCYSLVLFIYLIFNPSHLLQCWTAWMH